MDLPHPKEASYQTYLEDLKSCIARYCSPKRPVHSPTPIHNNNNNVTLSLPDGGSGGASLVHRVSSAVDVLRGSLSGVLSPSFGHLV